jgi:Zn finger protein HypA/HybF involved in hydrogenase expression
MKRWYCMDCRTSVELDKHGRCEGCESEAVDLIGSKDELNPSVSGVQAEMMTTAQVSA